MKEIRSWLRGLIGGRRGELLKGPTDVQTSSISLIEAEKKRYSEEKNTFNQYFADANYPGLGHYYWYHTVDLGNGIVTPGDYDYRDSLSAFKFPKDMQGMKVLDVGSATGFFTFEFERRGANVIAVDLPSLYDWDIIHDEKDNVLSRMMTNHNATTLDELHYKHIKGPFDFCKTLKKSSAKRIFSSIYNLKLEMLGGQQFDLVFLGDILLHLFSPFKALDVIAPLCKHTLVIASGIFPGSNDIPIMRFLGTVSKKGDHRSWWHFNQRCIQEMVLRVGFTDISMVGSYSGVVRRQWSLYNRMIFHATK